jgi:hypothetical protein
MVAGVIFRPDDTVFYESVLPLDQCNVLTTLLLTRTKRHIFAAVACDGFCFGLNVTHF